MAKEDYESVKQDRFTREGEEVETTARPTESWIGHKAPLFTIPQRIRKWGEFIGFSSTNGRQDEPEE